jgi:hypothetical protein
MLTRRKASVNRTDLGADLQESVKERQIISGEIYGKGKVTAGLREPIANKSEVAEQIAKLSGTSASRSRRIRLLVIITIKVILLRGFCGGLMRPGRRGALGASKLIRNEDDYSRSIDYS